jgi:hypothetical protein
MYVTPQMWPGPRHWPCTPRRVQRRCVLKHAALGARSAEAFWSMQPQLDCSLFLPPPSPVPDSHPTQVRPGASATCAPANGVTARRDPSRPPARLRRAHACTHATRRGRMPRSRPPPPPGSPPPPSSSSKSISVWRAQPPPPRLPVVHKLCCLLPPSRHHWHPAAASPGGRLAPLPPRLASSSPGLLLARPPPRPAASSPDGRLTRRPPERGPAHPWRRRRLRRRRLRHRLLRTSPGAPAVHVRCCCCYRRDACGCPPTGCPPGPPRSTVLPFSAATTPRLSRPPPHSAVALWNEAPLASGAHVWWPDTGWAGKQGSSARLPPPPHPPTRAGTAGAASAGTAMLPGGAACAPAPQPAASCGGPAGL